ncbi:hypothetical protein QZH41_002460 [Actinostola sp. cb2023]|nr:hypothetical protein QZH41_002460 [Actinostola sp. cb2023]
MYKSRDAFNVHNTKKHKKPSSIYDQLKVAKLAIREEWFTSKERGIITKYPWGETRVKQGDKIAEKNPKRSQLILFCLNGIVVRC